MRVKDRQRRAKRGLTVARNGRGSNTATVRDVRELLRMVQSQLACKTAWMQKNNQPPLMLYAYILNTLWLRTCTPNGSLWMLLFVDLNECSSEQFGSSKVLGSKPPSIASIERFSYWLLVVFYYAHILFIHSLLLWIFWIITRKVWLFDFDHLSSHPIAWGQFSALVLKPPNDLRRRVVSWRCWNNMETLPSHSTDWQHLTASRMYIYVLHLAWPDLVEVTCLSF